MDTSDKELRDYYRERAPVYDRVYSYPERQRDLRLLERYVREQFAGRDVIEIAAGTGYWTQFIAAAARKVLATDVTAEALERVQLRPGLAELETRIADAYSLDAIGATFSGAFAGLWVSHVPRQRLPEFFASLHGRLEPGATVVLLDNSRAQCERLPLSFTDHFGNTFQDRELDDGSVHRVLKNFPTEAELLSVIGAHADSHEFLAMEHFWLLEYRFAP